LRLDAQVPGDRLDLLAVQPAQALLGAAQIEEQLALGLGGGDLHDAPVAQDEFVDLGADPVHRERHQADTDAGVEALHGLHQADVAFLDQVAQGQAVAAVAAGDMYDETEVRDDQPARRRQVVALLQADRQIVLLLLAQHGYAVDRLDVTRQVAAG